MSLTQTEPLPPTQFAADAAPSPDSAECANPAFAELWPHQTHWLLRPDGLPLADAADWEATFAYGALLQTAARSGWLAEDIRRRLETPGSAHQSSSACAQRGAPTWRAFGLATERRERRTTTGTANRAAAAS